MRTYLDTWGRRKNIHYEHIKIILENNQQRLDIFDRIKLVQLLLTDEQLKTYLNAKQSEKEVII